MSASREKKQRQNAGPDQKALKAQQEQAARRRTTIIYSVIAIVIAALVVALLVWRSGFFQSRASAASMGSETLSTAELSFYYYDARRYTVSLASYGLNNFDTSKPDDEQEYLEGDGQTYRDYFMETALANAQQHKALSEEAVKLGHSESEVKENVDAYIDSLKTEAASAGYSYAAYLRAMYGPYMTSGVLEKLYTRYQMAALAATEKHNELLDSYTQADLDDYYKADDHADELDTVEYSYLYFPIATVGTTDTDGNTLSDDEVNKRKDEAKADAKKKAEEALEAVEGGASFQAQADKYELTSSVDHSKTVGTASLNAAYREQLLALDKDECGLVETDSGYYVISFHDRYLDTEPTRDVRHILVRAENTTGDDNKLVAPTDEAWADAKAKMDEIQAAWDASDKSVDAFAKLANEKSDDGDGTTGGLYERIARNSNYVAEFLDWIYPENGARTPGDVGLVQHSAEEGATSGYYGYHLIYYVGENDPVWAGTVRDALADEAQQTWIDGLTASYPTALTGGAKYLGT